MTKPRKKPATNFHAFLVEPHPGFVPKNWRENPKHYRIIEYVGPKHFKGRADAWKFLHNHEAIHQNEVVQWAIYLDFAAPIFGEEPMANASEAPGTNRPKSDVSTGEFLSESSGQSVAGIL